MDLTLRVCMLGRHPDPVTATRRGFGDPCGSERMDWIEARRRLLRLTGGRAGLPGAPDGAPNRPAHARFRPRLVPEARIEPRAASLCVASGKGGTGKTVVTASLARLFAARGRTLILDADLGVGNAHILQDVSPERTLVDVVEGRASVRDVRMRCGEAIDLVGAGSGVSRMAALSAYEMHLLAHGVGELEREYAHLLVDSAAGISGQTLSFAEASDVVLVVTTPDLTAMTDAYAFLKVLYRKHPDPSALLLVNRAADEDEALRVERRISDVCHRFLGAAPRFVGWIPDDPAVTRAVNHRATVVSAEPDASASRALRVVAVRVLEELGARHPRGLGRLLLRRIGYSGDAV
jgi:flagellar biosynthesis protein FlhG